MSAKQQPASPASVAMLRVLLLVDVRLYREGLLRALDGSPDFRVVDAAPLAEINRALLKSLAPDIVLLEAAAARSPSCVHVIRDVLPNAKVIAFAVTDDENDILQCAEAGVAGYVSREASITDLTSTMVRVARGEFPCSPRVAALMARRMSSLATHQLLEGTESKLTRRERQILNLIDGGLSNKEIARQLCIGLSTVKNHVHHILNKTCAVRRTQAAARLRGQWSPFNAAADRATRLEATAGSLRL